MVVETCRSRSYTLIGCLHAYRSINQVKATLAQGHGSVIQGQCSLCVFNFQSVIIYRTGICCYRNIQVVRNNDDSRSGCCFSRLSRGFTIHHKLVYKKLFGLQVKITRKHGLFRQYIIDDITQMAAHGKIRLSIAGIETFKLHLILRKREQSVFDKERFWKKV
ncbi:hypothetical protein D3C85_1349490 [compost metagenome]